MEKGLVRVLSGEEEIADLRTPKGIMITGPPGELRCFIGSSVAVSACGGNTHSGLGQHDAWKDTS